MDLNNIKLISFFLLAFEVSYFLAQSHFILRFEILAQLLCLFQNALSLLRQVLVFVYFGLFFGLFG